MGCGSYSLLDALLRLAEAITLSSTLFTSAWTGPNSVATRCIHATTLGNGSSSSAMVDPCQARSSWLSELAGVRACVC